MSATLEVSVGYMTQTPAVGRLEFVIKYDILEHAERDRIPSEQDVLARINPYVLQQLGGEEEDWIIKLHQNDDENEYENNIYTYCYFFEWKNLNNKERVNPIMRTITFRPHRHRFAIDL